MKRMMTLTVGLCLLLPSVPALADQAADEADVRATYQKLVTAFNNHDAKAMMSMAADVIESWGGGSKGRAARGKFFSDYFAKSKIKCEVLGEIGVVFVSPEVAIYKVHEKYTGLIDDDGNPIATPESEIVVNVFAKQNGKWLWAARFSRAIEE